MSTHSKRREVYFYKNYYLDFYNKQTKEVKKKLNHAIGLLEVLEYVPEKHFKSLKGTDGLFEIRVEVISNIYRIFCFFDKGKLVILLNGFQKKTQKTPKNEIELAEKLKKQYFNEKESK
ncbi:MAG: type II toxin-antitoxin system RelE/ParE family toxin [Bacteroidota bacterium]|nr:type II toxin-antitoxin system RelE/ParE family toxin [Bacteroidota bacterium]